MISSFSSIKIRSSIEFPCVGCNTLSWEIDIENILKFQVHFSTGSRRTPAYVTPFEIHLSTAVFSLYVVDG